MKEFLKYVGPLIVLVGVALLALYYFSIVQTNVILIAAGAVVLIGIAFHVVINRKLT